MNDVAIWAEFLAVPVLLGLVSVVICMLKDRHEFNRQHPLPPFHGD